MKEIHCQNDEKDVEGEKVRRGNGTERERKERTGGTKTGRKNGNENEIRKKYP